MSEPRSEAVILAEIEDLEEIRRDCCDSDIIRQCTVDIAHLWAELGDDSDLSYLEVDE